MKVKNKNTQQIDTSNYPIQLQKLIQNAGLPDNKLWTNRFEIKSATSNRIYIVAQHKQHKHFGCSCPGWRRYRTCKHLQTIGLPCFEKPYDITKIT